MRSGAPEGPAAVTVAPPAFPCRKRVEPTGPVMEGCFTRPVALCMTNQGCTQAGDIQGSRIISGPIPATSRIGAAEPGSPVIDCVAMLRRRVRVGRAATAWADMRGLTGLLPFQTNTRQETLVAQHAPQFSTHLGIIAPISPPSLDSSPTPGGLHGLEGFAQRSAGSQKRWRAPAGYWPPDGPDRCCSPRTCANIG